MREGKKKNKPRKELKGEEEEGGKKRKREGGKFMPRVALFVDDLVCVAGGKCQS